MDRPRYRADATAPDVGVELQLLADEGVSPRTTVSVARGGGGGCADRTREPGALRKEARRLRVSAGFPHTMLVGVLSDVNMRRCLVRYSGPLRGIDLSGAMT